MAAQPPTRLVRDGLLVGAAVILGLVLLQQRLRRATAPEPTGRAEEPAAQGRGAAPPAADPDRPTRPRAVGLTTLPTALPPPPPVKQDFAYDPAKRELPPPPPGGEAAAAPGDSSGDSTTAPPEAVPAGGDAAAAGAEPPAAATRQSEAIMAYHSALQAAIEAAAGTMSRQGTEYSLGDLAEIVVDALAANGVTSPGQPVLITDGAGAVLAEIDAAGWWHLAAEGERRSIGAPPAGLGPGSQMVTRVEQNADGTSEVVRSLYTQLSALNLLLVSGIGGEPAAFDPAAVSP